MSAAPTPKRLTRGCLEQRGKKGIWWNRHAVEVIDERTGEVRRRQARIKLGSYRSQAAAEKALDGYLGLAWSPAIRPGPSITVREFAAKYDRSHIALLRRSSARTYRAAWRCHLLPVVGARPLHAVGTEQLQEIVTTMHAAGKSRATIRAALVRLIQLLHQAAKEGFAVQPMALRAVALPREQEARRERPFLDAPQLERLLAACDLRRRALFGLGAFAGLRCGEILGLRWSDVNFDPPTLHVRQNAVAGQIGAVKTARSQREVPLLPALASLLAEYHTQCGRPAAGLLFATRSGKPLDGGYVRRQWWRPRLRQLGLPDCGLHALRHSTPRLLDTVGLSAGAIQQWLGHSSLQQTEQYLHVHARDLRTQLDAALLRDGNKP